MDLPAGQTHGSRFVEPLPRKRTCSDVSDVGVDGSAMAKDLSSTKNRKRLGKKSFALPGKRKYPIPDKAHARNALARVAQHGSPTEKRKVRAAVKKRFPSLGKKSD
jgi:hypothetical protein